MKFNYMVFLLLLGTLVSLSACAGLKDQRRAVQYFTLEYSVPKAPDRKRLPVVIRVERFMVAPAYNTQRMIYRDQAFKRDEYFYYKWRSNPGDTIAYLLSRDVGESGLFKAVLPDDSRFPYAFMIEGRVNTFLQVEESDGWYADLSLTLALLKADEPDVVKRILFQKTYQGKTACREKNPQGLARAMSAVMKAISQKIILDVYEAIENSVNAKKNENER